MFQEIHPTLGSPSSTDIRRLVLESVSRLIKQHSCFTPKKYHTTQLAEMSRVEILTIYPELLSLRRTRDRIR